MLATPGPCLHLLYFSIGTCYNNLQNFGNVWVIFTRKTFFGFLVSANAQMIHVVMIGSYCNLNLAQRNFLWLFQVEMIHKYSGTALNMNVLNNNTAKVSK